MSRWDALRPEPRECATRKPRPPSVRKLEHSDASLDWHVQLTSLNEALKEGNERHVHNVIDRLETILKTGPAIPPKSAGDAVTLLTTRDSRVFVTRRLELTCRILKETKIILTNHQVKQCVDNLNFSGDPKRIDCWARLVLVASRQMPAEETANELVGNAFMPVLESPDENVPIVLNAIQCLVSDPLHASAMLTPLTLDVTEQGQEDTVTNPLRSRLMLALQSLLGNKAYSGSACLCLIRMIKTTNSDGDVNEMDVSLLEPFFVDASRSEESRADAFDLLRLVLKRYPTASTSLSSLLIGDRRSPFQTSGATCAHCKHHSVSPLLDLLHDTNNASRLADVIPCIQELLQSMPLHIWLSTSRSSRGIQHFGKQTSEALIRLIRVVQCRFRQCPSSIPVLCPLNQVILTRIPSSEYENDELKREAMDLLSLMAQVFMRRRCPQLVECFVFSMGGRPLPDGGMTTMSIPMQHWLSSVSSRDFREYLWSSLELSKNSREECIQVICAIARSLPSFILEDQTTWERCQRVIAAHASDSSYRIRLDGVSFLEKLLMGRMEKHEQNDDTAIAIFASSIAWAMLKDTKPQVRTIALNCYGAFLPNDWLVLSELPKENVEPAFQHHVNAILSHCVETRVTFTDGEPHAGVRAAACKCIGSVCTQFLSSHASIHEDSLIIDEERETFCKSTCDALVLSVQDSNAGVRSMVSLAIETTGSTSAQRPHCLHNFPLDPKRIRLCSLSVISRTFCEKANQVNSLSHRTMFRRFA